MKGQIRHDSTNEVSTIGKFMETQSRREVGQGRAGDVGSYYLMGRAYIWDDEKVIIQYSEGEKRYLFVTATSPTLPITASSL